MIVIRIDPQTNTVTWDEPTSDTLTFKAATFREAVGAAVRALEEFGLIMDKEGVANFDLSKE